MKTIAVIDIGSNSLRMGIYKKDAAGKPELLDQYRYSTKLAEGLAQDNLLKEEPMKRTLEALAHFKHRIKAKKVSTVKTVATECLRRGENSGDFLKLVKNKTGLEVEILTGEQEAAYGVYAACASTKAHKFYTLDTGGGSFELSLVENRKLKEHVCLPYGSVVLSEEYQPDQNGMAPLLTKLEEVIGEISWLKSNHLPLVILGGSNRVVSKIVNATDLEERIEGTVITFQQALSVFNRLYRTNPQDRYLIEGMEESRAGTIIAGLCPLLCIAEKVKSNEIVTCINSLREGVAAQYLK